MEQQESSTAQRLLELLLQSRDKAVSGQQLSVQLGVTRAAVWKAVTSLRAHGYTIESATNRGYRITELSENLSAASVRSYIAPPGQNTVICLPTVDSTLLYANRLLLDGAEDGTVVLAEEQTAGAGRLGRSFASVAGAGIYLSMIYKPQCSMQELGLLTSCVGLAVCQTLTQCCGVQAQLKWPNDVMLGSRKVCGILTRLSSDAENNTVTHAIIGIGVNVLQEEFPPELAEKAVSVYQATQQRFCRAQLAGVLISKLNSMLWEQQLLHNPPPTLLAELRQASCTIGKRVRVVTPLASREGVALDIDSSGELLVQFANGVECVTAGEVSVRGLLGYHAEEDVG